MRSLGVALAVALLFTGAAADLGAQKPAPASKQKAAPAPKKAAREAGALTTARIREFLRTAPVIQVRDTSKGVTAPKRLTLSDGVLTHDAVFQSVDERKPVSPTGNTADAFELNFVDSYKFNLAAYELAELLGIGAMMPVHVEREWNGRTGSLSWWMDVQFDEEERRRKNVQPPDSIGYNHQMYRMRVFAALIRDTDRNLGNILYTPDWRVIMIDFTRAFRLSRDLINAEFLTVIDRALFKNITALTRERARRAVGNYLNDDQLDAMMRRRDALEAHYRKLIAARGEAAVLY